MKKINVDDGYFFGLGVFETIAVERQSPILLSEHLERMRYSLAKLDIHPPRAKELLAPSQIQKQASLCPFPRGVLKISASSQNLFFTLRENTYTEDQYHRGFHTRTTPVFRNETSLFTYHKTTNYGENIWEKRRAHQEDFDEPIFLNTQKQICEGATTNIFFVREGRIFTPRTDCGLLNGVLRRYLLERYPIRETTIYPEQVLGFDELFLTNSLLGIMPVASWNGHSFPQRKVSQRLLQDYQRFLSGR